MSEWIRQVIEKNHHRTVVSHLGICIDKVDKIETVLSLVIDERHLQHVGLVHGGLYVLLEETAMSLAGACNLSNPNETVVALEINANHVRSETAGRLITRTNPIHIGSTTMVYEARITNEKQQLISVARSTLMIIKPKPTTTIPH